MLGGIFAQSWHNNKPRYMYITLHLLSDMFWQEH